MSVLEHWWVYRGHSLKRGHCLCASCGMTLEAFRDNDVVCPGSVPKPATAEPPEWKRPPVIAEVAADALASMGDFVPGLLTYVYDPAADSLKELPAGEFSEEDLIVVRPAGRFMVVTGCTTETFEWSEMADPWSWGDGARDEDPAISRAMLTPITFTAKLGERT